jgi:hypothetical protein
LITTSIAFLTIGSVAEKGDCWFALGKSEGLKKLHISVFAEDFSAHALILIVFDTGMMLIVSIFEFEVLHLILEEYSYRMLSIITINLMYAEYKRSCSL